MENSCEMKMRCFGSLWILLILFSYIGRISYAIPSASISGQSTVIEGNSLHLTCIATNCNVTCRYQWTFRSSDVGSLPHYSINNVSRDQVGVYTCTVTDVTGEEGKDTHNVTVFYGLDDVAISPTKANYILNETTDALGPINCNVTNCHPGGNCSVSWFLPKKQILADDTLRIPRVNRNDTGQYNCTGYNSITGIMKSKEIYVTVNYGPDRVIINGNLEVEEGSSYRANCSCGTCVPGCTYRWSGKSVNSTSLSFSNINRNNSGVYECTCSNTGQSKELTKIYTINVLYPPDVNVTWDPKNNRLRCTADGNPKNYSFSAWTHEVGSTSVRSITGNTEQNGNSLVLNGTKPYMDTGDYTCSVSNGHQGTTGQNEQTRKRHMTFEDTPVLVEMQREYNVSKGFNVVFSIVIYAIPSVVRSTVSVKHTNETISIEGVNISVQNVPVSIRFYNIKVSPTGTNITIKIAEVKEEYFGDVQVEMRNRVGSLFENLTLIPKGPPDTPTNITYKPDINSVFIKLKPGFYNGANQTFYIEYSTDKNATNWNNNTFIEAGFRKAPDYFKEVTVYGMQPESRYYFRIKGVNMYGDSEPTEVVEIKTLEEPVNAGAIAGGVVGGVIAVVVIIIVIIIVKRRADRKKTKKKDTIPMPNILDISNSDQPPIFARSPNVYTPDPWSKDSVIYANTALEGQLNIGPTDGTKKEHIYGNTLVNGEDKQDSKMIYQNVELSKDAKSSQLNRQESNEAYYSNYSIPKDVKATAEKDESKQTGNDSTPTTPTEQPYLEMEINKGSAKYIEEPYLDMEVKEGSKDYINVEGYKKVKPKPPISKKPGKKIPAASDEYVSLHMTVEKRESMPDFIAPSPPKVHEEDYMNLNLGKKS